MSVAYDVIPVTLVTGFLGSGKSTLLADLLQGDAARDTAVLVNEFGEVGLDHLLVGAIDAQTILLDNGCLCCAVRGELREALATLFSRRARGEVPAFSRVVLETSGLATPAPIVATLLGDPIIRSHFVIAGILTVVDAANFEWQQRDHPEWLNQVSAADRLLVGKADLVDQERMEDLLAMLAELNPTASIVVKRTGIDADVLRASLFESGDVQNMIRNIGKATRSTAPSRSQASYKHREGLMASHVTSFCMTFDAPLDWEVFTLWLTMLLNRHGNSILRVKGLLWIRGSARPAVLHAIRHIVYPVLHPQNVDVDWTGDKKSQLVFIAEGLELDRLVASYRRFQHQLEDCSR